MGEGQKRLYQNLKGYNICNYIDSKLNTFL